MPIIVTYPPGYYSGTREVVEDVLYRNPYWDFSWNDVREEPGVFIISYPSEQGHGITQTLNLVLRRVADTLFANHDHNAQLRAVWVHQNIGGRFYKR